ncbi:MAG: hypothetical protein A2X28_11130 [Elusimicrobia bacterium GWA2_56_46]|jgi:hypothetical protein|nr:MAG: hypothetical protein A2X28_11130 [Elusimicrobia bacterium GWA2_56_46]OGR54152.1 MAG: hypothetical protein A2X39_05505 [Elusimicrobia bacterium GWC2_56_31]HBB68102.1 hypothetical protein [Elusimicrobiota bacterium]HBW23868.1 hypothetical protein [Elusimicrobiota bacterium]
MLKRLAVFTGVLVSLASFASAEVNFDNPSANDFGKELGGAVQFSEQAVPVPVPVQAEDSKGLGHWLYEHTIGLKDRKEWTIMVYINGKNDLEKYALKDMNEMEMIGSSWHVNIVAEVGRMDDFDASDGDWKGTRRYLIARDTDTARISSPVVEDLGKSDMGDYKNVVAFGRWAKAKYPAKKYMLVVWNHGAGWLKRDQSRGKGISYDDETGNHINTPQMGLMLKEIGGVDVYGSDACLMQMAEVVYELRHYADYIVGSEETEPGDGYTYDLMLGPLVRNPKMTPEQFGKTVVDAYSDHYQAIGEGSTQSLIKSAALSGLRISANAFAAAMIGAGEKDLVKKAMEEAQSYAYIENKDLYHFAQLVVAETKDVRVETAGKALMYYIRTVLVVRNRTNNGADGGYWSPPSDYSNSHGIAVYLPGTVLPASYKELKWSKYSDWDRLIDWIAQPEKKTEGIGGRV